MFLHYALVGWITHQCPCAGGGFCLVLGSGPLLLLILCLFFWSAWEDTHIWLGDVHFFPTLVCGFSGVLWRGKVKKPEELPLRRPSRITGTPPRGGKRSLLPFSSWTRRITRCLLKTSDTLPGADLMLLPATVSQFAPWPTERLQTSIPWPFPHVSPANWTMLQLVSHLFFNCMLMSRLLGAFLTLDWLGSYLSTRTKWRLGWLRSALPILELSFSWFCLTHFLWYVYKMYFWCIPSPGLVGFAPMLEIWSPCITKNAQCWHAEGHNLQKPLDLPGSAARTSSLRNKTVHTKSFPKLSHFYTTNTQAKCLCTCCFVSFCWRATSLTQKAAFMPHVDIFMSTLTKTRKTRVNPRKLYIMTWFVCSNMFECLKNVEIFQTPTSHPKTCCLRLSKKKLCKRNVPSSQHLVHPKAHA